MRETIKTKFLVICFIVLAFCVSSYAVAQDKPDCNVDSGTCAKKIGDVEVILDINPKPVKAMKELFFTVTIKGKRYNRLMLDLDMPGMYMGKNMVVLEKISAGKYKGKGVIPRCPSGRKLWRAKVYPPDSADDNMKADFIFNVSY